MSRALVVVLSCLLTELAFAQSGTPAGGACLSYEPSVVQLTGTVVRKTFPGPPNYEDARRGNATEVYWMLELSHPVCVDTDKQEPDLNPAQEGVQEIQLVFVNPKFYKQHKGLIGKQVVAVGTLFGGHTGHHHSAVLLTVSSLTKAP